MTDPNATISPQEARRREPTRMQTAIIAAGAARRERLEGTSPEQRFWLGLVRNFVLGLPFAGLGFIWIYRAWTLLDQRLVKCECAMTFGDMRAFIPGAILLAIGVAFLAPGQAEAVARFLGLGNIIDRLPFLKPKAEAAP